MLSSSKAGLVSLRGTMVPAKTLNKFLSKLPIVGDIIIPKEIGEGLFGISFKMKGTPGKIKLQSIQLITYSKIYTKSLKTLSNFKYKMFFFTKRNFHVFLFKI